MSTSSLSTRQGNVDFRNLCLTARNGSVIFISDHPNCLSEASIAVPSVKLPPLNPSPILRSAVPRPRLRFTKRTFTLPILAARCITLPASALYRPFSSTSSIRMPPLKKSQAEEISEKIGP